MKLAFPQAQSFLTGLSIFLLLFPVCVYGYVFFLSLVDFPFYDDFFWYNKLIIQAKGQPLSTQLGLIVQQHSDHRLIFLKGMALIMASVGPFDFRWPVLLTNGLFLLFSVHLVIHIYRITRNWLFAVPCLFILFQFQPYTVAFSYGPQTLGILLFVYFSFFYVWKTGPLAYGLTAVSAFFCVITNTNGLFVLPILVLLYGLTHRFRAAICWGLLTVISATLYFSGDYQWNAGTVNNVPASNKLLHYYLFLAELLGSWANNNIRFGYLMAISVGSLILLCIGWLLIRLVSQISWKRWFIEPIDGPAEEKRHLLLTTTSILGFILLTCLLLTYKRYAGTDSANNIVPHYRQYSTFALCLAYVSGLLLFFQHRGHWIYVTGCTLLAIIGNLASYLYVHQDLRRYTLALQADAYNSRTNHSILFFPPIEGETAWRTITQEMALSYSRHYIASPPAPQPTRLLPGSIHATVNQSPNGLVIELSDSSHTLPYARNAFVVLRNAKSVFYFPFINYLNSPRTILKKRALFQHKGYTLISRYIPNFVLPAGTYQASVVDENEGTRQRIDKLVYITKRDTPVE